MNVEERLAPYVWKLVEEMAELQKVLASCHQIGWDATHPSAKASNLELALHEVDDVIPAACRLWYELTQIKLLRGQSLRNEAPAPDLNAAAAQAPGQ